MTSSPDATSLPRALSCPSQPVVWAFNKKPAIRSLKQMQAHTQSDKGRAELLGQEGGEVLRKDIWSRPPQSTSQTSCFARAKKK